MLVAMTFNAGLFVCVIAGLALGTLMFGHILAAEPTIGYDGVPSLALSCCHRLLHGASLFGAQVGVFANFFSIIDMQRMQ